MLQQSTLSVNLARFIRGENVDVLTELEDGWETHYMRRKYINYQCLEFRWSGLKLLTGMKELKVLDITSTAHTVGVAELDWAYVHSPWAGDAKAGLSDKVARSGWLPIPLALPLLLRLMFT